MSAPQILYIVHYTSINHEFRNRLNKYINRRNVDKMNNRIAEIMLKKSPYILLYVIFSYALSKFLVFGADIISYALDTIYGGYMLDVKRLVTDMAALIGVSALIAYLRTIVGESYSIGVQYECRDMAVWSIQGADCKETDKNTGLVINRLTSDMGNLNTLLSEIIPEILSYIMTIIVVGVSILKTEWRIFVGIAVIFPVIVPISRIIAKKINILAKSRRGRYDELTEIAADNIAGIEICRTYGLEDALDRRVEEKAGEILKNEYARNAYQALANFITSILQWLPSVICSLIALKLALDGYITSGRLMAFIILFGKISSPLSELPFRIIDAKEMFVSVERLNKIINLKQESSGEYSGCNDVSGKCAIDCNNISFSYGNENAKLYKIDIKANVGEKIAIVGSSGSGKSTLFKILCGFRQPQSGEYKLFGHEFEDWNRQEARKLISYVPQDVFLFPDTIAENVAYGSDDNDPGVKIEKVVCACKKAGIHEKIISLPEGYQTILGERGATLSGGEKQRLAIARALYKNAPIMLMDEPTSSLDETTERIISNTLADDDSERATIVIAHRLSTIKNADRIYVMEDGTIVETGNHEDLMKKSGVYASLYNSADTNGGSYGDI